LDPAQLSITIHQRATFRQQFTLPFDCTGHTVIAQVWKEKRRSLLFQFTVEWVDQSEGSFYLVADYEDTTKMTKDGVWDLMVVYPNTERFYWVEGAAVIDFGISDPDA
jgi:hypothetical protein